MTRRGKRQAALALAFAAVAAPALGPAGGRAAEALAKLGHGRWVVRSASQAAVDHSVCLGDPAQLFQLEHGIKGCSQQLLAQDERKATAEYVCPGRGFGHTSIRFETTTTATIETQGMIDGRPFAYRATARKLSDC
jgi:sorbitol-specific phosphotransferase system component IIA